MVRRAPQKKEPIYEKLDPGQCYLLYRSGKTIEYACNEKGRIVVRQTRIPSGE